MSMTAYERVATYFDQELVEPLRQQMIGRKLFAKTVTLPEGSFNVDFNVLTEMGDAVITYDLPDESAISKDSVKVATSTIKLAVISKGYQIPRAQFLAFQKEGIMLDTSFAVSAAQVVGEKEDDMIIQGWMRDGSNYEIKGLYQSAGNSYTTTQHFSTYGNAVKATSGALALLRADKVVGTNFNMVLNSAEYSTLEASISTTGIREWDQVMRILNGTPGAAPGGIYWTEDITAATGMITPVDSAGVFMDLVIGINTRNEVAAPKFAISPLDGITYEVLVPRIKKTEAICTLTDIA